MNNNISVIPATPSLSARPTLPCQSRALRKNRPSAAHAASDSCPPPPQHPCHGAAADAITNALHATNIAPPATNVAANSSVSSLFNREKTATSEQFSFNFTVGDSL